MRTRMATAVGRPTPSTLSIRSSRLAAGIASDSEAYLGFEELLVTLLPGRMNALARERLLRAQ